MKETTASTVLRPLCAMQRSRFGRDYDVSHLASHPQQKTSSLRVVGRLDPAGGANQWFDTVNLDVTMTLNRDGPYATAHYSCSP